MRFPDSRVFPDNGVFSDSRMLPDDGVFSDSRGSRNVAGSSAATVGGNSLENM